MLYLSGKKSSRINSRNPSLILSQYTAYPYKQVFFFFPSKKNMKKGLNAFPPTLSLKKPITLKKEVPVYRHLKSIY